MTGMLTLAAREITERRTVLIAALAAGLMPFASPLFPGVSANRIVEARDAMALIVAGVLGIGAALLVGATVVGRDLAEGRMGFDFARPLGGLSIWGGKFLGAVGLALLVVLLTLAPTSAVGGGIFSGAIDNSSAKPLGLALLAILALVPLAHAAGIALRSRSGWLALDLVACAVVLLVGATAARRLIVNQAPGLLEAMAALAGLLAILALWIASVVQVTRGRTDLRRGHRALSISLWSMLLGSVALLDGYTLWVVAAGPEDLVTASGFAAPHGDWAAIQGKTQGRGDFEPAFLVDTASGRFVRLGGAGNMYAYVAVEFSADGRRAFRFKLAGGATAERFDLQVVDLDTAHPAPRETTLSFVVDGPFATTFAPDGRRFALLQDGTLSVLEVDSGKTLAAVRLPEPPATEKTLIRVAFLGTDHVRVYHVSTSLEIHDLDVGARALTTIHGPAVSCAWYTLSWTPNQDRLLAWSECEGMQLVDGRSGTVLAAVRRPKASGSLVSDGRVALTGVESGRGWLQLFSRDGGGGGILDLGLGDRIIVGGDASPGKLVVAMSSGLEYRTDRSRLLLVDLDTGRVDEVAQGLVPAVSAMWWSGRSSPRLFYRGNALVRFDPSTREERLIAGVSVTATETRGEFR